jgi:rubrerythrin
MGKFRDSQTARNLMFSFAGESQARNRYTYFARRAMEG